MTRSRAVRGRIFCAIVGAVLVLPSAAGAATVASGSRHTVVLDSSGTVWTWGRNASGQLGIGSTTASSLPVQVPALTGIVAVAAGENHTLALGSDGRVWAWGLNASGQLGDGTTTTRTSPVEVLTGASKIAAGERYSVALKPDGSVFTWGVNTSGQLGRATTPTNQPGVVPSLSSVTSIAAGADHTLALRADGSIWTWGFNATGQLGDGSQTNRSAPVQATGLEGLTVVEVAGADGHSLARTDTGRIYAWGDNTYGQLGDGTIETPRLTPAIVADAEYVTGIAAGGWHSAAVLSDGSVLCWGQGANGEIGDGTPLFATIPIFPAEGPLEAIRVAASGGTLATSGGNTVVVTATGEVWAWGDNTDGQIGDGTTGLDRTTPVQIMEAGFVPKIGTPIFSVMPGTFTTEQSVSLSSVTPPTLTIRYTTDGSDPTPSSTAYAGTPISVNVSTTIKAKTYKGSAESNIATGIFTLRAAIPVLTPGSGDYSSSQSVTMSTTTSGASIRYTTDGTLPTVSSPTYTSAISVNSSARVSAVAFKAGWSDSIPRTANYTLNFGTLATPTADQPAGTYVGSVTVGLSAAAGTTIRYTVDGSNPTGTSAVYSAPLALTTTTTVKARAFKPDWNASGTLTVAYTIAAVPASFSPAGGTYSIGQTITLSSTTPNATIHYTLDGSDPTASAAAVPSGGAIYVGTFTLKARAIATGTVLSAATSDSYVQSGSAGTGAVAGGASHSLLLKPDGSVWAWGANSSGQLGDTTTTTPRKLPVQAATPSGVVAIAAGASHSLALTSGGLVYVWGSNASGQLGLGATPTFTSTPTQITSLSGVVAIAAGANHSLAVKSDGSVWAFGANASGQLGDGSTTNRNTPVQVTVSAGVNLGSAIKVGAGSSHSLAVKSDGTAWSWGLNANGQIGNGGTSSPQTRAVQVNSLTGVTAVEGGDKHSLARKSDGTGWAWGYNLYGQLGSGDNTLFTSPHDIVGLTGATSTLQAGLDFSVGLSADWMVSTWGRSVGLGTGSTSNSNVAEVLDSLPPMVAIGAGDSHVVAIAQDGSVWSWGLNASGQIGDGTTVERKTPVKIADANFAWKTGTPAFAQAPGSYTNTLSVTITTATAGATIYYTTNGTEPTTSSSVYSTPVSINVTTTLKAKAVHASFVDSEVASGLYSLEAATPLITPSGGTYDTDKTVTLTSSSPGVTIRYRTDGQVPTASDPGVTSGQTITVTRSLVLRANAWRSAWTTSAANMATFTMKAATPTFNPAGGVYSSAQSVTVATTTSGAVIRYTTSGREPTQADPIVASGSTVSVAQSASLKARVFRSGWTSSDTGTATFVLNLGAVASPTFSPAAGTYSTAQTVALATTTAGSAIRYTTDGSEPTIWSPVYAAPIAVGATATVKARAYHPDRAASSVASATYTISTGAVEAPALSVPSGSYATWRRVYVSSATSGATIRYTTNGANPTTSDAAVASGSYIDVHASMIVKAAAWKSGMADSAVTRHDYLITGAVAAGTEHALALKEDGSVWSWGKNQYGQLGDGTTTTRLSPVAVSGLTDVVAVAAGGYHSLALKADGTVWSWGRNDSGQIGDGTSGTNRLAPVQVSGLTGVSSIAAGSFHSLAVLSTGSMKAWGNNGNGRLGNNSTTNATSPVSVSGVTTAAMTAGGADHSLARLADGTVVGWGNNAQGQLGAATPTQSLVPMAVPNLSGVTAIAAGTSFSYALRANGGAAGGVWSFGAGASGQLGDGTLPTNRKSIAAAVANVRWLAAGDRHGLAFRQDGRMVAWGADDYGQLGDGTQINNRANPVHIRGAGEVVQLAAGGSFSSAVLVDGTVATWGYGERLGQGSSALKTVPDAIPDFRLVDNAWLSEDTDADGLSNGAEYRLGSDATSNDTNQDGVQDGDQFEAGAAPTSPDTDGDGLPNSTEREQGTDPLVADTDRDGAADGVDCYPLDSSRTTCGTSNPSDTTPPTITLDEPPGAVPVP